MKKTLQQLLLLAVFGYSLLLISCGKTGPLYLPDSPPSSTQQDK